MTRDEQLGFLVSSTLAFLVGTAFGYAFAMFEMLRSGGAQ